MKEPQFRPEGYRSKTHYLSEVLGGRWKYEPLGEYRPRWICSDGSSVERSEDGKYVLRRPNKFPKPFFWHGFRLNHEQMRRYECQNRQKY